MYKLGCSKLVYKPKNTLIAKAGYGFMVRDLTCTPPPRSALNRPPFPKESNKSIIL